MPARDAINQPRALREPRASAGILPKPLDDIEPTLLLPENELEDLPCRPCDGVTISRSVKGASFTDWLPNRPRQTSASALNEKQREQDILVDSAGCRQVLLKQMGPSEFQNAPAAWLRQHGGGHEEHRVAALENFVTQGAKGCAAVGVIVAVQPRGQASPLQRRVERENERLSVLPAVGEENMVSAGREELDLP
jgi:hypothetical protein